MSKFRGEGDGCGYCDFYKYATKDHFCQRGKHMNYQKCGWYADPREPQKNVESKTNTQQIVAFSEQTKCPACDNEVGNIVLLRSCDHQHHACGKCYLHYIVTNEYLAPFEDS